MIVNDVEVLHGTGRFRLWGFALMLVPFFSASHSYASDSAPRGELSLKPVECVVLQQGKSCHATVRISWKASSPGQYCLYSSREETAVKCWTASLEGQYRESIATKGDVEYHIRRQNDDRVFARAKLNVVWVYRESIRPTRQWRLF